MSNGGGSIKAICGGAALVIVGFVFLGAPLLAPAGLICIIGGIGVAAAGILSAFR